ncbi:MAG: S66 peptidase family protein [Synechocystis sp.]
MFNLPLQFQKPQPLQPGDRLMVVSTSGSLRERQDFDRGIEIWRSWGYEIVFSDHYQHQNGYLAGTDQERRASLRQAWLDPDCRGILCSRGGYGGARLLEGWDWPEGDPKWLLGFSDVTGILWSLAQAGVESLHGPVLTTLADEPDWSLNRLHNYLTGKPLDPLSGNGWGGGKVQGRLIVANLTVATHLLGTLWQPNFDQVILAIEDVGEAPYRIDRMLTQWRLSGALERVAGIALGRFSGCDAPPGFPSWSVEEVLRDRLQDFNVPMVTDLPFGHDGANAVLPVGAWAELDGDRGLLTCLPTPR